MTLPPQLAAHKTMLAAILVIARLATRRLAVEADGNAKALAQAIGVNRTYVYEVVHRVLAALEALAKTPPGRPHAGTDTAVVSDLRSALTIRVLRFQVDHLGAVLPGPSGKRTEYSPAFRRFILERHDEWPQDGTLEDFAAAVFVPLDTLRDWLAADRNGLPPAPTPPESKVPADACGLVLRIVEMFQEWHGSTRQFLGLAARSLGLLSGQVFRVLVLTCMVRPPRPRPLPGGPRYRGETDSLSPGAMLVVDAKTIDVDLTASGQRIPSSLHLMADQATSCVTGLAVRPDECSAGVLETYRRSLDFLGGRAPLAILHDNKPPYADAALRDACAPVPLIPATLARPENKAVVEGLFGAFEQQVGRIRIDDKSPEAIATSAVAEVARAFYAGINHAQRHELDGRSREAVLRWYVPSPEQLDRDARFLRQLQARHRRPRRARQLPESRQLLDEAFRRYDCLRHKDPRGSLRAYLAYCHPSAVRQALAILATKVEQDAIESNHAHRYLAALVKNCQNEYELQRCEHELLASTRAQRRSWTEALDYDLQLILAKQDGPLDRLKALAERAALGGLPVEGAFWTEHLLEHLAHHRELFAPLRTFLCRYHEAPCERRLALLDQLAALEAGLL